MSSQPLVDTVAERRPAGRLLTLGLHNVLVMYTGAIAVPLIVGRALKLDPEQVAFLISADLFVCGLLTIMQSLGATGWVGIKLPVMIGVTFASVGPMVAIAATNLGTEGARMVFGAIIGAGLIAMLIAPLVGRMLRFFPPVVAGMIVLVIGVTLMRVGINWIFGLPVGPTAPMVLDPAHADWPVQINRLGEHAVPVVRDGLDLAPTVHNPAYATPTTIGISALVLVAIVAFMRLAGGFVANISVLLGIIIGAVTASVLGIIHFDSVADAGWFALITPFRFGLPIFDPVIVLAMTLVMTLVMIVVTIETTCMFLAPDDICRRKIDRLSLSAGLRTDGLGTLIGGLFNTFPNTSFSQNVRLVGVIGIRSCYVTVTAGALMIVLGLVPRIGALVESMPVAVLGGAGLVMFGMVAATGVRTACGSSAASTSSRAASTG